MASTTVSFSGSAVAQKERSTVFVPKEKKMKLGKQLALQALLLFISFLVLFPILWVVSMSLDPRGLRPLTLTLIPANASLDAYLQVLDRPTNNPVGFWTLSKFSLMVAT